jgi:hypothetical protein
MIDTSRRRVDFGDRCRHRPETAAGRLDVTIAGASKELGHGR